MYPFPYLDRRVKEKGEDKRKLQPGIEHRLLYCGAKSLTFTTRFLYQCHHGYKIVGGLLAADKEFEFRGGKSINHLFASLVGRKRFTPFLANSSFTNRFKQTRLSRGQRKRP